MTLLKKLLLASILASSQVAIADFTWGVGENDRIFESDGTTRLTGSRLDASAGYFVELIFAGANESIDFGPTDGGGNYLFDPSNTSGVYGDDVRVGTAWVGKGTPNIPVPGFADGYFFQDITAPTGGVASNFYYVRAWEAPSADQSTLPIHLAAGNINFGVSSLLQDPEGDGGTGNPPLPAQSYTFGGFNTSLVGVAIPEPGTLALFGIGGFALWNVQRRKKKNAKS